MKRQGKVISNPLRSIPATMRLAASSGSSRAGIVKGFLAVRLDRTKPGLITRRSIPGLRLQGLR